MTLKMRVCICDSVEQRRYIKEEIVYSYFSEKETDCQIVLFESAEKLIISDVIEQTDIFIINTCLGDTDGINAVRELKDKYKSKVFIITSDNYDYLDEVMDLGVIRYILNNDEKERFYSALDKAIEDINNFIVFIKESNGNIHRLHKNEIVFAESKERKTRILTSSGMIQTNMRISTIKEILNTPNFINPHYSFVVNSDYISHVEGRDIFVKVSYHYFRVPIAAKRLTQTKKQLANV